MKAVRFILLCLLILGAVVSIKAEEKGQYRLLSISQSEKLILVSKISDKSKYLLDVAAAKITVDGKPAELDALTAFTAVEIKWNKSESKRNGVRLDGTALEIEISNPENSKGK